MSESIHEARLGIIDTIRGVLLDLADADSMSQEERFEIAEQMGDVAELILEALEFEITSVDGNKVAATLELEPI